MPPRFRPALAQAPLTQGFDLGALLAVPIERRQAVVAGQRAARPRPARRHAAHRRARPATLGIAASRWTPQRDLLASARRRARFRRRDRGRRPRAAALRRRRARPAARPRTPRSPRPIASATAPPAMSAPRRSPTSSAPSAACSTAVRNPMPAAGGVDPEDIEAARRDAPAGVPHPGARGHRGRLRRRRRAARRRAARGRDVPLDRQLAHRVRHRRPLRRRRGRRAASRRGCAAISSASAWPATTSRSTRRASCRSTSRCTSASSRTTSAPMCCRRCGTVLSSARAARRPLGLFHPDNFTFGEPVYLSRIVAAAQAVEGVEAVRREKFQRLVEPDRDLARRRRDPDRRARDRPARQQSELPRARPADARGGRRQMSAPVPTSSRHAAACRQRELRLLRRRRSRDAAGHLTTAPACRAIAYRIGDYAQFRASLHAGLSSVGVRSRWRELRTPRRRRFHDRPDRRLRLRGRRAHLLPGAHRQRILSAHRRRARLAAGDGQADRLPPAARRGGRDLARLRAGNAARAARQRCRPSRAISSPACRPA